MEITKAIAENVGRFCLCWMTIITFIKLKKKYVSPNSLQVFEFTIVKKKKKVKTNLQLCKTYIHSLWAIVYLEHCSAFLLYIKPLFSFWQTHHERFEILLTYHLAKMSSCKEIIKKNNFLWKYNLLIWWQPCCFGSESLYANDCLFTQMLVSLSKCPSLYAKACGENCT